MLNKKNSYLGAELEILLFASRDVIATSSGVSAPKENPDDGLPEGGWT